MPVTGCRADASTDILCVWSRSARLPVQYSAAAASSEADHRLMSPGCDDTRIGCVNNEDRRIIFQVWETDTSSWGVDPA